MTCERRYEIQHLNFGSFSRHFRCPSRKHCSVSILLLTSDITRPNENIYQTQRMAADREQFLVLYVDVSFCTLLVQVHLMTFVLKGHQRAEWPFHNQ